MAVVTTKEELERAINSGETLIIIRGELAKDVKNSYELKKISKATLMVIGGALAAIPFTGGLSASLLAPLAASTGVSVGILLAAAAIGFSVAMSLIEKYEIVEYKKNGIEELTLKRK